jgi:glyoxalase family protein
MAPPAVEHDPSQMSSIMGIHHVTAFAKDPRKNHHFYTQVLGMRMVKQTVNFDDPTTYHLYYGDAIGTPGTLLTFFPHPRASRGTHGSGELGRTVLTAPEGALRFWESRLRAHGIDTTGIDTTLPLAARSETHQMLVFEDPDGMPLAIVEADPPWNAQAVQHPEISIDKAFTGIESIELCVLNPELTSSFLREILGFRDAGSTIHAGVRSTHLTIGSGGPGKLIHVVDATDEPPATTGAGSVHHVAWRVDDEHAQTNISKQLRAAGVPVTRMMDRNYFRSIYFRIPGNIVFEIATDGPGFTVDESQQDLGATLQLPKVYEARRSDLLRHLVPIRERE